MTRPYYDVFDVRALCELANKGSFNRAAEALFVTPSALSRRIAKLEAAIGGQIVKRTTRAMELTEIGERLISKAQPLLYALDDAMEDASRLARGLESQVTLGCVATVAFSLIPAAIAAFKRDFPSVRINLRDGEGASITSAVLTHEVDLAVSTVVDKKDGLISELIKNDPIVLACPKGHPLAESVEVTWEEVRSYRLLGFKSHVAIRQLIDRSLQARNTDCPWFYEVDSLASLIGALRSGEFVAPVPQLLANHISELATVRLVAPCIERSIYLIRRSEHASVPASALWNTIRSALKRQT